MTKHVNVESKECASMGVCALNSEHEVICQSLDQVPDSQVINRVWRKTAEFSKKPRVLPRINYWWNMSDSILVVVTDFIPDISQSK